MNDNEIKEILSKSKTIAMIGVSSEKKVKKKTSQCCYEIYAGFWI